MLFLDFLSLFDRRADLVTKLPPQGGAKGVRGASRCRAGEPVVASRPHRQSAVAGSNSRCLPGEPSVAASFPPRDMHVDLDGAAEYCGVSSRFSRRAGFGDICAAPFPWRWLRLSLRFRRAGYCEPFPQAHRRVLSLQSRRAGCCEYVDRRQLDDLRQLSLSSGEPVIATRSALPRLPGACA